MIDRNEIAEEVTERSKKIFEQSQNDMGEIHDIRISWDNDYIEYNTVITGEFDTLILSGFSIGYKGKGPDALMWLLDECEFPYNKEQIENKVEPKGAKIWNSKGLVQVKEK